METETKVTPIFTDGSLPLYVNVYRMDRNYGGPEEGGWWYDSGECVKTTICFTRNEAEIQQLRDGVQFPRTNKRFSVLGGTDHEVWIEDTPGSHFPTERPHYE